MTSKKDASTSFPASPPAAVVSEVVAVVIGKPPHIPKVDGDG
jgi:hypothetical protein